MLGKLQFTIKDIPKICNLYLYLSFCSYSQTGIAPGAHQSAREAEINSYDQMKYLIWSDPKYPLAVPGDGELVKSSTNK